MHAHGNAQVRKQPVDAPPPRISWRPHKVASPVGWHAALGTLAKNWRTHHVPAHEVRAGLDELVLSSPGNLHCPLVWPLPSRRQRFLAQPTPSHVLLGCTGRGATSGPGTSPGSSLGPCPYSLPHGRADMLPWPQPAGPVVSGAEASRSLRTRGDPLLPGHAAHPSRVNLTWNRCENMILRK